MSSTTSRFVMDNAVTQIKPFFEDDTKLGLFITVSSFGWFVGGMLNDGYLYFISCLFSLVLYIIGIILYINPVYDYTMNIGSTAFRRFAYGGFGYWMYTTGKLGPETISDVFGFDIPVLQFSQLILIFFILLWTINRYLDLLVNEEKTLNNIITLGIRSIMKGLILFAAIYAFITKEFIPLWLEIPLLASYLFEPIFYYLYHNENRTLSTFDMNFGNARLPTVALRETIVSNTIFIIITTNYASVNDPDWNILRVIHIIVLITLIIISIDSVKKFNQNPLKSTKMGTFLNDNPLDLNNLKVKETGGHLIQKELELKLSKDAKVIIEEGAVVIPIKEEKGYVNALIVGKGQNILTNQKEEISQQMDGITTLMIPKKEIKSIVRDIPKVNLAEIDLSKYGLPSLEVIENSVKLLSVKMAGWVERIRAEIMNVNLNGLGISEQGDTTRVNLGILRVVETPEMTHFNGFGIKVYDTPNAVLVNILNLINVVELPKVTFVNLPGITVFDLGKEGQSVEILGFKITSGIDPLKLEQFKQAFYLKAAEIENRLDSQLGKILASDKPSAMMSLSWNGEFLPLLEGNNKQIGNHPALNPSVREFSNLLSLPQGDYNNKSNDDIALIELTGVDNERSKSKKKRINVSVDISTSGSKVKSKNISNTNKEELRKIIREKKETRRDLIEERREFRRSLTKSNLSREQKLDINEKLAEINREIINIEDEIKNPNFKQKIQNESSNFSEDNYEIIDADYEILDDE